MKNKNVNTARGGEKRRKIQYNIPSGEIQNINEMLLDNTTLLPQ
jgi:hypothetical protein